MFGRKVQKPHVPAKVRAFGRARLEMAQRAQTRQDWDALWKPPMQPFPFEWGPHWKQCIEYKVDDFSAEVGFLIDVLGLPVNAFNPDYAMFTGPDGEFYFAVVAAGPGASATPPDALRIQFMVADIFAMAQTLQGRGIQLEQEPAPVAEGSAQWVASFRTPHGICMEIWGLAEMVPQEAVPPAAFSEPRAEETAEAEAVPGPALAASEDFSDEEEDELEAEPAFDAEDQEDDEEDDFLFDKEDEEEADQESEPLPHYASRVEQQPAERLKPVLPVPSPESPSRQAAAEKPVRLLPRSTARPAPKKTPAGKASSIWDGVSPEVEYLDLESQPEEEGEAYHYKPIPLKRDE